MCSCESTVSVLLVRIILGCVHLVSASMVTVDICQISLGQFDMHSINLLGCEQCNVHTMIHCPCRGRLCCSVMLRSGFAAQ